MRGRRVVVRKLDARHIAVARSFAPRRGGHGQGRGAIKGRDRRAVCGRRCAGAIATIGVDVGSVAGGVAAEERVDLGL